MKKIVPIFMACLVFCSVGGATVSAAVPPDNGSVVSPCYLYTDSVNCNLTISGGVASCKSTVYGISGAKLLTAGIAVILTHSRRLAAEPTVLKQLQRSTRAHLTKRSLFTVRRFCINLQFML